MIDESTDLSVSKKLIVYVKIINNKGQAEVHFVRNVDVPNGTAETVTEVLETVISELVGEESSKLVGIASDGAAVMVGKKTGVVSRLKKDRPWIIAIHCVAH